MKLTELPSMGVTKEYIIECTLNDGAIRCNFQVYEGKIEHVSDYTTYGWARGKTMVEVVEWTVRQEDEAIKQVRLAKEKKRRVYTETQKRLMLYAEENRKRKVWEAERWHCMEGGEGYFAH